MRTRGMIKYHGQLFLDDLGREEGRVARDSEVFHELGLDLLFGVQEGHLL